MLHIEQFNIVQTGIRHEKQNVCCQDCASFFTRENITIAAVSDGCSSAALSHIGSDICVRTFIDTFSPFPDDIVKSFCTSRRYDRILKYILSEAIAKAISKTGISHQLLSATLVGCICYKKRAVFLHVGDGFASRMRYGHINIVSRPENNGCSNRTFFITSPDSQGHIRIMRINSYQRLLISTDGLSGIKLKKEMFFQSGLKKLLLDNQKSLYDDCGVVLIGI